MTGLQKYSDFIQAAGLGKNIASVESVKKQLRNMLHKTGKDSRYLIAAIRLEHLQIKKHQKIALKYRQELEEKIALEFGATEQRRKDFKETYQVK